MIASKRKVLIFKNDKVYQGIVKFVHMDIVRIKMDVISVNVVVVHRPIVMSRNKMEIGDQ